MSAHSLRVQSVVEGKLWKQECEEAGYIASASRNWMMRCDRWCLAHCLLFIQFWTTIHGMVLPTL